LILEYFRSTERQKEWSANDKMAARSFWRNFSFPTQAFFFRVHTVWHFVSFYLQSKGLDVNFVPLK
jgi:hypothetical protein